MSETPTAEKDAHVEGCLWEYPLGCHGLACKCPCHAPSLQGEARSFGFCGHMLGGAPCTYDADPATHPMWHTHDGARLMEARRRVTSPGGSDA